MFLIRRPTFELGPVLAAWTDAPRFTGNPKKDPTVEIWLAQIEAGCLVRKVPQSLWPEVGRSFMSAKAQKRLVEVERVMRCMHGEAWVFKWKTFVVAMKNMGWNSGPKKTRGVKLQRNQSGSWWIMGLGGKKADGADTAIKDTKGSSPPPTKGSGSKPKKTSEAVGKTTAKPSKDVKDLALTTRRPKPIPVQSSSSNERSAISRAVSSVTTSFRRNPPPMPPPATSVTLHVPLWLVACSEALDTIPENHPRTISILSAILITVGSLPLGVALGGPGAIVAEVSLGLGIALKELGSDNNAA